MLTGFFLFLAYILDFMGFKKGSRALFLRCSASSSDSYVVYCAARALIDDGRVSEAERLLWDNLRTNPTARCGRLLIHLLIKKGDISNAVQVADELLRQDPANAWLHLLRGDLLYFFSGQSGETDWRNALQLARSKLAPVGALKVALKRITRFVLNGEPSNELKQTLQEFMELTPSNFHDVEFKALFDCLMALGDKEEAKMVLEKGIRAYPRSKTLRDEWERNGFGSLPPMPQRGSRLPSSVEVLPVKTRLLTEADDPVRAVMEHVPHVESSAVVALSSCVAGLMDGRIFMEGAVIPGITARLLSRFVDQKNVPFGGAAPMANPVSMQVLLEEIGTLKVVAAAVAGAIGKLLRRKGWFYVVAGKDAGQIDDILGSLPPYDYYVIMGPKDPEALAQRISNALGCKAAVVDANDLGVAWAVGVSENVNRNWLETVMSSNPAGNQEQQTPIVIVRTL